MGDEGSVKAEAWILGHLLTSSRVAMEKARKDDLFSDGHSELMNERRAMEIGAYQSFSIP